MIKLKFPCTVLSMYYFFLCPNTKKKNFHFLLIIAMQDSDSFFFISTFVPYIWYGLNNFRPLVFHCDLLNRNLIAHSLNSSILERKEKYPTSTFYQAFLCFLLKCYSFLMFTYINYHIVTQLRWSEYWSYSPS